MYGKALWGAALALRNMGRKGEAMTILNELLKYYDYKEANDTVNALKKAGVKPIAINRDLDYQCYKQIMFIAKSYGLDNCGNKDNETIGKNLFEEIFSPFFDYLIDYYKDIDINRISKISSEFMLFAGMASSKYLRDNWKKLVTEGIIKVLSGPRGFFAMDEECCDYLGISYKPDNGNALSPCMSQLTQEANRIYSDIIAQVKEVPHIKILIHDISKQFFAFGFSYVEYKMKNSLDIYVKPNDLSPRDVLTLRLKSLANDPAIKTAERSEGAMCYSIGMPEKETYRCSHCGAVYYCLVLE